MSRKFVAIEEHRLSPSRARRLVATAVGIQLATTGWSVFDYYGFFPSIDTAINVMTYLVAVPLALLMLVRRRARRKLCGTCHVLLFVLAVILLRWMATSPSADIPHGQALISIAGLMIAAASLEVTDLRFVRSAAMYMSVVIVCVVFVQEPGQTHLFDSQYEDVTRVGLDALMPGNTLNESRTLMLGAFTVLGFILYDKRIGVKVLLLPVLAVGVSLGLATGQRGPLVSFVVATVALWLGVWWSKGGRGAKSLVAVGVPAALVSTLYLLWTYRTSALSRMLLAEENIDARYDLYRQSMRDVTIFGHGVWALGDYSHNIFLEVLFDYGVVALAGILLVVWGALRSALSLAKTRQDSTALWLLGFLVFVVVSHQFSFSIFDPVLWTVLILAIVVGRGENVVQGEEARAMERSERRRGVAKPTLMTVGDGMKLAEHINAD